MALVPLVTASNLWVANHAHSYQVYKEQKHLIYESDLTIGDT